MLRRLVILAGTLAAACMPALHVADRAQAVPGNSAAARVEAGGVTTTLVVGDERSWLATLPPGLMPVEVSLENESGRPIQIAPEEFVLVLPGGARRSAMHPGEVIAAIDARAPSFRPRYPRGVVAVPPARGATAYALLYSWPGLHGTGAVSLPDELRPDPRPRPEGTLPDGGSGSVVVFFDVAAARLKRFSLEVSVAAEDGEIIGTATVPFAR